MTEDFESELDDDDVISLEASTDRESRRDRDGVSSLRDTEEEAGDEDGLADDFDLDARAAREVGADLDGDPEDDPRLD